MWVALSDLRFQSDAATLLSVMLILNAVAAMALVPAWVLLFKPRFITGAARDGDAVPQAEAARVRDRDGGAAAPWI
jgi:hypothetical protein